MLKNYWIKNKYLFKIDVTVTCFSQFYQGRKLQKTNSIPIGTYLLCAAVEVNSTSAILKI